MSALVAASRRKVSTSVFVATFRIQGPMCSSARTSASLSLHAGLGEPLHEPVAVEHCFCNLWGSHATNPPSDAQSGSIGGIWPVFGIGNSS